MENNEDLRQAALKSFEFYGGALANYGWLYKDGLYDPCSIHICHAGLRRIQPKNSVAVVSQIMWKPGDFFLDEKIVKAYYQWLLNDSPLADAFISKDVDEVFGDKFILLRIDSPNNVMLAAAILHRYIWEETKVPKVWFDLVEKGMEPNGAFVLAHLVNIGDSPWDNLDEKLITINPNSKNLNHTLFEGVIFQGTLTNFRNGNRVNVCGKGEVVRDGSKICVKNLYQRERCKQLFLNVRNHVNKIIDEEKTNSSNPFATQSCTIRGYKYQKLLDALVEAFPKICEEDEECAGQ